MLVRHAAEDTQSERAKEAFELVLDEEREKRE
jgi:hypothetical protein